jgi:hypothetical protein
VPGLRNILVLYVFPSRNKKDDGGIYVECLPGAQGADYDASRGKNFTYKAATGFAVKVIKYGS